MARLRQLIASASSVLALGVTACGGPQISPDSSTQALRARQTGIFLATLASDLRNIVGVSVCDYAGIILQPLDNASAKQIYGRGSNFNNNGHIIALFAVEVPAGQYGIIRTSCGDRAFNAAPGQPFATFSVGAGEVVEIGQLTIHMISTSRLNNFLSGTGYAAVPLHDPMPADALAEFPVEHRNRMVRRPMRPLPLPRQEIEALCELQTSQRFVGKGPLCDRLAGNPGPTPQISTAPLAAPPLRGKSQRPREQP